MKKRLQPKMTPVLYAVSPALHPAIQIHKYLVQLLARGVPRLLRKAVAHFQLPFFNVFHNGVGKLVQRHAKGMQPRPTQIRLHGRRYYFYYLNIGCFRQLVPKRQGKRVYGGLSGAKASPEDTVTM